MPQQAGTYRFSLFPSFSPSLGATENRINCDKTIGRASALLEGIAVHETCAPAPRDASKVDKPQRSPCDAVTNATEIAPPGENQPRFDTFVREKHGRCSPLFTIDKGTLESAIAIVPRYIPAISQTQHEHTVTRSHKTCTLVGSDSSHIVRANYQTLSSRRIIVPTPVVIIWERRRITTGRFRLGYSWNISICREITGETAFSITRDGVMTEITRSIVERCRTPDFLNSLLPSSVTAANDRREFRLSWNGWNATAGPENKPSRAARPAFDKPSPTDDGRWFILTVSSIYTSIATRFVPFRSVETDIPT